MLLVVEQVGRTTNSVTINISGITEGDRQTYIWLTGQMLNSDDGDWVTLQTAINYGYVSIINTNYETNNGNIKVTVSDEYLNLGYRIVELQVTNINTTSGDTWAIIDAILGFEYDGSDTKYPGDDIDITVNDLRNINQFGRFFDSWLGTGESIYYKLSGVDRGDKIFAYYLRTPSQNIFEAVFYVNHTYDNVEVDWPTIHDYLYDINTYCLSGADFKAEWFNNIKDALEAYNEKITAT